PAGHDSHLTPVFELVMAIPSQTVPFGFEVGEFGAKQSKPTGSDVVLDARRQRSARRNDGLFPGLVLRERFAHGPKLSRGGLGRQSRASPRRSGPLTSRLEWRKCPRQVDSRSSGGSLV